MKLAVQEHIILTKICEFSLDAVLFLDSNFKIIWSNRATKRIIGYSKGEINKKDFKNLLNPSSQAKLENMLNATNTKNRKYNGQYFELEIHHKNGIYIPIELSITTANYDANIYYLCIARDITERKRLLDEIIASNSKIHQILKKTLSIVGKIIEKRDPYTAGHQFRVANLAIEIAKEMNLDDHKITSIYFASLVHDIGKIAVPTDILNRPGKLLPIEMEMIKIHPITGYELLNDIDFPWPIAEIAYQHHERLNGSGYPRGLKEHEILLETKVLSVADVVESMMSHRPYRPALTIETALDEIIKNSGILYDPNVVNAFVKLLRKKKEEQ